MRKRGEKTKKRNGQEDRRSYDFEWQDEVEFVSLTTVSEIFSEANESMLFVYAIYTENMDGYILFLDQLTLDKGLDINTMQSR